jgi:hypothetical protein
VTVITILQAIGAQGGRVFLRNHTAMLERGRCTKALVDAAVLHGATIQALLEEWDASCAPEVPCLVPCARESRGSP